MISISQKRQVETSKMIVLYIYIYVYLKFAIYNLELVDNDSDENSNNKHNNCNNMITIVMLITKLIKVIKVIKLVKLICVNREGWWFEDSLLKAFSDPGCLCSAIYTYIYIYIQFAHT